MTAPRSPERLAVRIRVRNAATVIEETHYGDRGLRFAMEAVHDLLVEAADALDEASILLAQRDALAAACRQGVAELPIAIDLLHHAGTDPEGT